MWFPIKQQNPTELRNTNDTVRPTSMFSSPLSPLPSAACRGDVTPAAAGVVIVPADKYHVQQIHIISSEQQEVRVLLSTRSLSPGLSHSCAAAGPFFPGSLGGYF